MGQQAPRSISFIHSCLISLCVFYSNIFSHWLQIKSIEKKISSLKESLNGNDAEEKARAQHDIESFQQELASIFAVSNC